MVLEPSCFAWLRAAMAPDVGMAVGALRDPLVGRLAGVKMYRRECFEELRLRDVPAPEIDWASFRFRDWVGHDRVADFVNASDVVAMPSAAEAQALVYLETAACGRTLIASDIPAAREVVEHGRTGLLFPTGDAEALAAAILTAARDPELRMRLGEAARRAMERHSLDRVVAEYDELLVSPVAPAGRA